MGTLLSVGSAVLALLFGSPIFLGILLVGVLLYVFVLGQDPTAIPSNLFLSIDKFTFMAIPFFLLAGAIMTQGGMSLRLIRLVQAFFGHIPGGMALSVVIATALFAAMSGSSPATLAAISSIMYKPMIDLGYPRPFVIGLMASSATLGILIPPSVPLLVYAGMTDESASALFIAGIIPGLFLATLIGIVAIFWSWKKGYHSLGPIEWAERWKALREGIWVLGLPVIIMGGIYGGFFTPTESAAIAVAYALLICGFVYKSLTWKTVLEALKSTALTTAMILTIVATSMLLSHALTSLQVPQVISEFILGNISSIILLLLLLNIFYIFMGMFLDGMALIAITVPIFYPVLTEMGINGIHYAIILIMTVEMAVITPPVGVNLYVIQGISKAPFELVVKGVLPFIFVVLFALIIVTYFPELSLFLPRHLGF